MGGTCSRCRVCCYSTPYGTIFALSMTVVGLVGFLSSGVYGIILVSSIDVLSDRIVILAPVLGGVAGTTLIPLLMATIMAYCATGYVRDELYHPLIKWCVGGCCNFFTMISTFMYLLIWILFMVALSLIMTLYLELVWACPQFESSSRPFDQQCFNYNFKNNTLQVCTEGFNFLCDQGQRVGLSLAISLAFSLVVVLGFITIVVIQAANYVSVRESNKRSYRPGGDY